MIRRFWNKVKKLNAMINSHEIIIDHLDNIRFMESERYRQELFSHRKYSDGKRLEKYGFKVYSQSDEDGIIQEIFDRIGVGSRTFVEFGVENGLENNTLKLLLEGWSGLLIEGNERCVTQINQKFHDVMTDGRLRVKLAFINCENVNDIIEEYFTGEIDLLSIDIDGNDIHILKSISVIRPRVIIVEYNGKFPPPINVAQLYNPEHRWSGSDYGGSSLVAITKMASHKGYSLVGCSIVGINAFFVRNDLLGEKFQAPFTAGNHYESARYFLTFPSGHTPDWGPYEKI